MRRSLGIAALCVSSLVAGGTLLLAGCEDGPKQTYAPATGRLFDNGDTHASSDPAQTGVDGGYAAVTPLLACTDEIKRERWAKMLTDEIKPPRFFAGLDFIGGNEFKGLSLFDATGHPDANMEGANCQGVIGAGCGASGAANCQNVTWGNNSEVYMEIDTVTNWVDFEQISNGYTGVVNFQDRAGTHKYVAQVGRTIMRDGQPFLINWTGNVNDSDPQLTEIFNAILFTFGPTAGLKVDTDVASCTKGGAIGNCLNIAQPGNQPIVGIRPMSFYIVFNTFPSPQPAQSTIAQLYGFGFSKLIPSSTLPLDLGLGKVGPTSIGTPRGAPATTQCLMQLGMQWQDYLGNCIKVSGDPTVDGTNLGKLIAGRTHDYENIIFSTFGAHMDFALQGLGDYGIVQDSDLPKPTDTAINFNFDIRSSANVANDNNAHAVGAATGLIDREWVRLTNLDLARLMSAQTGTPLLPSDPGTCSGPNPTPARGHICTGLETTVIPGVDAMGNPLSYPSDPPTALPFLDNWQGAVLGVYGGSALEPRDKNGFYCVDAANAASYANTNIGDCVAGSAGHSQWEGARVWVTRVLGKGSAANLPLEARGRQYYNYWWGIANLKYQLAWGQLKDAGKDPTDPTVLTPDVVAAQPIDAEMLFFDIPLGNDKDYFEYIDLSTIDRTAPPGDPRQIPIDWNYANSVYDGNTSFVTYWRRFDREEKMLYTALSDDDTAPPAWDANRGVNLTNIWGSSILSAMGGGTYQCASELWAPATQAQAAANGWCTVNDAGMTKCDVCVALQNPIGMNTLSCPTVPADYGTMAMQGPCYGTTPPVPDPSTGGYPGGPSSLDLNGRLRALDARGQYGAVNDNNNYHAWLYQYPAVFGGSTIFSPGHSAITVDTSDPPGAPAGYALTIQGARVTLPNFLNSWAACGTQQKDGMGNVTCDPNDPKYVGPLIKGLVPWLPQEPGVGFTVPLNGTQDKWISSQQLDFTGVLETFTVDYVSVVDPVQTFCNYGQTCSSGYKCDARTSQCVAADNTIHILAIESQDFLGEVFPCQDLATGDVLHVRMYDSGESILNWIAAHPGVPNAGIPSATDNCSLVVRFSPYDNFLDFITSLANGVRINIEASFNGQGRVADASVFDTAVLSY